MYPSQPENKNQKIIASFMVILAVVIIAVGVSALTKKNSDASSANNTSDVLPATTTQSTGVTTTPTVPPTSTSSTTQTFKDGSYSATGNYQSPGGTETITVSLTVKSDAVTDVSIQQAANNHDSEEYQTMFRENYKSFVVGKALDKILLSRVSGSSLTSGGFNAALEQIKTQAQS